MTSFGRRITSKSTWRDRGLGAVIALVFLSAMLSFSSGRPASAASNGQWSVYPTTLPGQAPRAVVRPTLTPGKTYSDAVTVANLTAASLTFHLYAADAINTPGGGLSLRRRTDVQRDIGNWIKLPYSMLTVPPRSGIVVPYTISPPEQAPPGAHVGGIVAEDTQGTTSQSGSIPITVIQAVGLRIFGNVSGPSHPKVSIAGLSLIVNRSVASQFGGSVQAKVSFQLRNLGNTVLSPQTRLTLTTPIGTAQSRRLRTDLLLPGGSLNYSITFRSVNTFGHLRAQVVSTASGTGASAAADAWTIPWALLVLLLLVVLFFVGLTIRMRRRGNVADDQDVSERDLPESALTCTMTDAAALPRDDQVPS
jgi:hypothetical protein